PMSRVMSCLPVLPVLAILEATGLPARALAQGVTTPPVAGIAARVTTQGTATVSWTAVAGATSYHVVRWNPVAPGCCKNMSAPNLTGTSWQDGTLPQNGTYTYRVYAITPSGTFAGEANLVYNVGVASTTDPSL